MLYKLYLNREEGKKEKEIKEGEKEWGGKKGRKERKEGNGNLYLNHPFL